MSYELIYDKAYAQKQTLPAGGVLKETVAQPLDTRYRYKVRLRSEVGIPFNHRTEASFPVYFRKIDDSLLQTDGEYALCFDKSNLEHERSCYQMVRGDFKVGEAFGATFFSGRSSSKAPPFSVFVAFKSAVRQTSIIGTDYGHVKGIFRNRQPRAD